MLQNQESMQVVKEALNEGYCDVSGRAGNLKLLGKCTTCLYKYVTDRLIQVRWAVSSCLRVKVEFLHKF